MKYRPKNWDIMDYCSVEEQGEDPLLAMHFFEAGADAMLEALKQLRDRVICEKDSVIIRLSPMCEEGEYKEGTWYFVPDEKEED